jgi:fatty acid desaturase
MARQWRGWSEKSPSRRRLFIATIGVVVALAVIAVVGTLDGRGLDSPWLWSGLVLVPVLLGLVARAGLNK